MSERLQPGSLAKSTSGPTPLLVLTVATGETLVQNPHVTKGSSEASVAGSRRRSP